MQSVTENEKVNKKLAQIRAALRNGTMIKMMNQNEIDSINCQVVATKYLQLKHSEWIGNTVLHFAAEKECSEAFDILLNHGADFTIKNNRNSTVLHQIMEKHVIETSEEYALDNSFVHSVLTAHLKYNNFKNPSNENGLSHFHIACAANNVEVAKRFLQSGVSIDHSVKVDSSLFPGYISLHFAVKYCALEVAELLLTYGVNVSIKDAKGMTPLHIALERKLEIISDTGANEAVKDSNERILQLLLSTESNNNVVTIDNWGLSNFHVSCALKDSKVAEHFLSKVENINHAVNMDSPLWPGFTALHFATLCNFDTVKLLMKNVANINIKDANGITPFDICIEIYKIEDISTIISLNPVSKNIMLSDGKTKLTDLIFAMKDSNQLNTFLSELNKNISICKDSPLWPGCSPMHLAVIFANTNAKASKKSQENISLVLKYLNNRNSRMLQVQDIHGQTPLHLAFRFNRESVFDLLFIFLELFSNLGDRIDKDGLSFVHIVSAKNQTILLRRLLSMKANINAFYKGKSQFSPTIYSGSTPLHIAVANGNREAIHMLIEFGADVYAKDANDMTPIHLLLLSKATTKVANSLLWMPNLKDSVVKSIGLSHLHVACWFWDNASLNAVIRLLDDGADINAKITFQRNTNANSSILTSLKQYEGHSPLTMAFNWQSYRNFEELLERGADIFVEYEKGVSLVYNVLDDCAYSTFDFSRKKSSFLRALSKNEAFIMRLKVETGMTPLQIACIKMNTSLIEESLSEGADVNELVPLNSPFLQGYTPMHIVMHFAQQYSQNVNIEVVELLLKAGADVTLQSTKLGTAIHMAYKYRFINEDMQSYCLMNMLLEAQQDFSINPTNVNGISHFHIACFVCNANIVGKFLDYGEIDINQRIDYFSDDLAGYLALQFAAESKENLCTVSRQLETIDLLLTHGADVHIEDFYGQTPVYECMLSNSADLVERLARSGADVNARNINGDTPLYYYLKSMKTSIERTKTFIRLGCRLNTYCTLTHKGYLGETINVFSYESVRNLISALVINFKREMQMDNMNRTIIHNIVSIESPRISVEEYAELIDLLSRGDCDIDDQDNLGRTALHLAVKFCNVQAVSVLLLAGADINIADNNGKTALACNFDAYRQRENNNDQDETKWKHFATLKGLTTHVKKLQRCGLDVNKQNKDFTVQAVKKLQRATLLSDKFFEELEAAKSTKIQSHALISLDDLLSEYGTIVDYPRMSEIKRNDINKFFSPDRAKKFRKQFPELAGIVHLQYRKARIRSKLVEMAKNALTDLSGFRLPEICSEFILILLKSSELKNLIVSMRQIENEK